MLCVLGMNTTCEIFGNIYTTRPKLLPCGKVFVWEGVKVGCHYFVIEFLSVNIHRFVNSKVYQQSIVVDFLHSLFYWKIRVVMFGLFCFLVWILWLNQGCIYFENWSCNHPWFITKRKFNALNVAKNLCNLLSEISRLPE